MAYLLRELNRFKDIYNNVTSRLPYNELLSYLSDWPIYWGKWAGLEIFTAVLLVDYLIMNSYHISVTGLSTEGSEQV